MSQSSYVADRKATAPGHRFGAGWRALALALCGACSVAEHAGRTCDDDTPCAEGQRCYRGFCLDADPRDPCAPNERRECYDGPRETIEPVPLGRCRPGTQVCGDDGFFGPCEGQILPQVEACTGEDDDCDGNVDEIAGTPCMTGRPGVCAAGSIVCGASGALCAPDVSPMPETCNGLDDDCDGHVDEGTGGRPCYPDETEGCAAEGEGFACNGLCQPGATVCEEGTLRCDGAVVPTEESCGADGLGSGADEDCNGRIDEGCNCVPSTTRECYGGPAGTRDVGACVGGTQTCGEEMGMGMWGTCAGEVRPSAERCDGADNDCNGEIDDVIGLGGPCTVEEFDGEPVLGECRSGTLRCVAGSSELLCVPSDPGVERCSGLDEDCDGVVDNDPLCPGSCCGDQCVDRDIDAMHCGQCFRACPTGNVCTNGECCAEGRTFCAGACVNTTTNREHCGECGNQCWNGGLISGIFRPRENCVMGTCQ